MIKDAKDFMHLVRTAPENLRYKPDEESDWLVGEEARDAMLEMMRPYFDASHPSFMVTDTKSTAGYLKWIEEGFDSEEFHELYSLGYGMSVDEGGRARSTVMVRNRNLDAVGGVQLSPSELMKLCRWAWACSVSQSKADVYDPRGTEGVHYVREQVGEMLKDLLEAMPEVVGTLLDDAARDAITDMARKEANERVEAKLFAQTCEVEKQWAKHIVKLAEIAVKDCETEREEEMADPLLQSYITRAVDLCADSKRH